MSVRKFGLLTHGQLYVQEEERLIASVHTLLVEHCGLEAVATHVSDQVRERLADLQRDIDDIRAKAAAAVGDSSAASLASPAEPELSRMLDAKLSEALAEVKADSEAHAAETADLKKGVAHAKWASDELRGRFGDALAKMTIRVEADAADITDLKASVLSSRKVVDSLLKQSVADNVDKCRTAQV